jgi:hypothetical protein
VLDLFNLFCCFCFYFVNTLIDYFMNSGHIYRGGGGTAILLK